MRSHLFSYHKLFAVIFLFSFGIISCRKAIEIDAPETGLVSGVVFESDVSAIGGVTSLYSVIMGGSSAFSGGTGGLSFRLGLLADELISYSPSADLNQYYRNALVNTNGTFWNELYSYIYQTNIAIEGLNKSTTLTPSVKTQLTGEAKFMRALIYFYAVNLYGPVPLITTTDYRQNALSSRTDTVAVYAQIVEDLLDAQSLLSDQYLTKDVKTAYGPGEEQRIRPTRPAAQALLARTYLYQRNWAEAETQASAVIDNTEYFNITGLDSVFLKNSHEAIWQLQPVNPIYNTYDAPMFVLTNTPDGGLRPASLNEAVVNDFESSDERRSHWVGEFLGGSQTFFYPYKYKVELLNQPVNEYQTVLRLAEQYLIRAEARLEQGNITGAQEDLNVIRTRAGLPETMAADADALRAAILHERRTELFTELGHRWLDLKRTGKVNEVMPAVTSAKGGTWNANWQYLPIPMTEIQRDPNLSQNAGY